MWTLQQQLVLLELAADYAIRGKVKSFDCMVSREEICYEPLFTLQSATEDTLRIRRHTPQSLLRRLVRVSEIYFRQQLAISLPHLFHPSLRKRFPLNALKLLWSKPTEGLQEVHYDVSNRAMASRRYSLIFYCTPAMHTAVPLVPADTLAAMFGVGKKLPAEVLAANLELLKRTPSWQRHDFPHGCRALRS